MRFVLLVFLLVAGPALAARVEVPLRVSLDTLRLALEKELRPASYRDGPCRYLRLEAARVDSAGGRLRLAIPGRGALGVELGATCRGTGAWRGTMRVDLEPRIDRAGRLRVRIVDSNLWEFAKPHMHARIERFTYDLGTPLEMLKAAGQRIDFSQPRIESTHVAIAALVEIPDAWASMPAPPTGAPLTEAELEALEKALEPWDAFLLYVVRHAALEGEDSELRQRLFTLLLENRYRLVALLSGDAVAGDPVRALFLDAWSELREILAPRYALLVDAGDALAALEAAAPGLPLSVDGLRQLARTLGPAAAGMDPLAYDWGVDRELGRAFGIDEITETEPAPPVPPTRSWLDFLIRRAHADQALERWVPTRAELPAYESRIAALLRQASSSALPAPYASVYRHLVPTTALIESCWRQYVVRGGKVTYLRSQASSVGMMQINQRVWRGFYDMERVRWDTAYNIRAGAQILLRYLRDYAIPFAERTGKPEHVARAAYAVYNGGPRAVGRFTKSPPHPREARVDERLWTLYEGIASGGDVDLASCSVKQL
jgi:hypothetical protein